MSTSKPLFLSSKQILILTVVLAIEIIGLVTLYAILSKNQQEKLKQQFESTSVEHTSAVEKEIRSNLDALSSINALYSVTKSISRSQFKAFNKKILSRNKSIKALEWIPIVKLENKDLFESNAHRNGYPNFQITEIIEGELVEAANREVYYPVFYLEPLSGNEPALGFDLGSNPTRLEAIKKSLELDRLVATAKVKLVQEKNSQNGVLVFSPIKKQGEVIGFSLGVYRIRDLINRALINFTNKDYNLVVYDMSADEGNQLLVQLNNEKTHILLDNSIYSIPSGLHFEKTIKIADREWLMLFTPTQAYLNSLPNSAELILIIFILLSIAFFYFIFRIFKELNRGKLNEIILETKVKNRTADLETANLELNHAIKSLSDYKTALDAAAIVVITDRKGNIEQVNENFVKISKYMENELIGKNQRIVSSGYHSKDFWKEMWATIKKGNVWRNEIKNKAKDGTYYWLDTTIVPLIHKDKPRQYLAIRNDITQRKNIEQKIINSIIYSQEQDREYFAEDLHEGLAQTLAGLAFQIQAIESKLKKSNDDALKESISTIKEYIYQSLENTRNLAKDLMPRTMMKYGLIPTIEQYIKNKANSKLDIEFKTNVEHMQIDKEIEITIYRTVVAIIENAKTSSATKDISIKIKDDKSCFQMKIEIPGSFKFISEINSDHGGTDYIPFQKRIEFHGGQMLIVQDTKPKKTNIIIKFESPSKK